MRRIVYLFCLVLVLGLVLVHLRTRHIHAVNRMAQMVEKEQKLRHQIWQQQMWLSGALESPKRIEQGLELYQVSVLPPGKEDEELNKEVRLTQRQDSSNTH